MPYTYDIFISYKRDEETNAWIKEHFEPLLHHKVGLELGHAPAIYRDDRLNDGGTWPLDLGKALGCSRVLIPLWTKTYFHSEWCVRELSAMLDRERETCCRTPANTLGLIIPIILHDCVELEPSLAHVQSRDIRKFFNVRMQRYSERAERLADELGAAASGIANSILQAPAWREQWPVITAESFLRALWREESPRQVQFPGFAA